MKIRNYLLLLAACGMMTTACDDYVDINRSTTGVTDEELEPGGLLRNSADGYAAACYSDWIS